MLGLSNDDQNRFPLILGLQAEFVLFRTWEIFQGSVAKRFRNGSLALLGTSLFHELEELDNLTVGLRIVTLFDLACFLFSFVPAQIARP